MLTWFRQTLRAGGNVLESEAAQVGARLRQLGVLLAAVVAGGCVGAIAICGTLTAVVLLAAPHIGMALALLLVCVPVVGAVLAALWAVYRVTSIQASEADTRAAAARARLDAQLDPDDDRAGAGASAGSDPPDLIQETIAAAVSNPAMITSAVFAAVSVLGVRRTLSLVRSAAAVASAGAVATQVLATAGSPEMNGQHRPGHGQARPQPAPRPRT